MWFRMEPGREEHIRGAVWVGKVNSQVRWEDRADRVAGWLAVELVVHAGCGAVGLDNIIGAGCAGGRG